MRKMFVCDKCNSCLPHEESYFFVPTEETVCKNCYVGLMLNDLALEETQARSYHERMLRLRLEEINKLREEVMRLI